MAKSIGGFLHHLMLKSGMNTDDENIKNFMANSELAKTEIPDYIEKGIDNQLISIKDAKNNHQEIKNWYAKQTLDGVDDTILAILDEEAADDEIRNRLLNIRSSYQKIPELVKSIKEKESKKLNASKPDKAEIQKEIDRLHQDLKTAQETNVKMKADFEKNLKGVQLKYALDKKLTPYKTIFDTLDPEVKATSIKTLIDKELQDNKLVLAIDDGGSVSLQKEDGTSYYGENHQLITPETFIEKTLSRNKLLITTAKPEQGNGGDNNGHQQPKNANGTSTKNATLSHLTQQALQDMQANQTAMGV